MKRILLVLCLLSNIAFGESYFVNSPKLIGAKDSLKKVVRELIVHELRKRKHDILGNMKAAKYQVSSTLMKLDVSYLLTLSLTGAETRSKKMKLKNLDDIDVTITRLVRSLVEDSTVKGSRKVEEITKQEQDNRFKKLKVDRLWIVGLGTAFLQGMDANTAYNTTFGYIWGLESYFDLFARMDLSNAEGTSDAGILQFMIGGNYFFTESIHAPYASAHFGYGWSKSENSSAEDIESTDGDGWVVGLGAGMKFFRASTVNFGIEGRYSLGTKDLKELSGETGKPSQFAISFLIFF